MIHETLRAMRFKEYYIVIWYYMSNKVWDSRGPIAEVLNILNLNNSLKSSATWNFEILNLQRYGNSMQCKRGSVSKGYFRNFAILNPKRYRNSGAAA